MDPLTSSEDVAKADTAAAVETPTITAPKKEDIAPSPSVFERIRAFAGAFAVMLAARPRLSRMTILAAAIAVSAALGSMVGAWAAVTFARPAAQPVPTVVAQTDDKAVAKLSADIAALKAAVDGMAKNSHAQLARINERVERSEKAQGEPAAKIARLADAVEKLERKTITASSADVTGSIATSQSALAPKQQEKPPVVTGWVIREVFDGIAMVESRHGLYEVVPGANLPGLGRVETIRRQDGRWVVVTPKGLIVSMR